MKNRALVFMLVMVMLISSLAGLASAAEKLSGSITVATLAGDPFQSSWRAMFDEFEAQTGVKVEHDAIPWENLKEKQALELASGSGAYDVVYVHPSWYEDLASNDYLVPISEYCDEAETSKYVENLLQLYNYKGTVYGLPDWIATQILAYRVDLFEAAAIPAPKTWDDVLAAAEKFADGDKMYGISFPARNAGALAGVFCTTLLSNGGWILDADNKPNMESKEVLETIQFLDKLSKYAPPGYQNFHWDENSSIATSGKTAMTILMTTNVAWLNDPGRSQTVGLWGYAPLMNTTRGGMIDSFCWSLAKSSANPEAAAALVKFMASTDVQIYLTQHMGTAGASKEYYQNSDLLASNPALTAMNEAFEHSKPNPTWSTWASEQDALEVSLQKVFNGTITAEQAMKDVQDLMISNRK